MRFVPYRRFHLPLTDELLDRFDLEADQRDVRHKDFITVRPSRPHAKIAAAEAKEDVPEPVVAVLFDGHPGRVVSPLAAADFFADPDLARREHDEGPPVEDERGER